MNKILCFAVLFLIILLFIKKKDTMADVSLNSSINDAIDSVYIIAIPKYHRYTRLLLLLVLRHVERRVTANAY